jgi:4-alpha-glucanotransferase
VDLFGDMPIYGAHYSAEVWPNQSLFWLDARGELEVVAGVPPDYFSATGQRWGNPLYRWDVMAQNDYAWWKARMRHTLQMVDIVRIDHFRGFEAYWEIPGDAETAVNGRWVKGPGEALFHALHAALGDLPIIAEDLGVITPEVEALRDRFAFPGMKILQFGFDSDSSNEYLPHNYSRNCVVYTGTHDNETFIGWFENEREKNHRQTREQIAREREHALKYMGCDLKKDLHWTFIRLAFASVADMAIIPLQDALGLGNAARMNAPGNPESNWEWRFCEDDLTGEISYKLAEMAELYGRANSARSDSDE